MILVSGATGNVGAELVKYLLNEDAQVRILVRDQQKALQFGDKVEVAIGDLEKPETLPAAMQSVERVGGVKHRTFQAWCCEHINDFCS